MTGFGKNDRNGIDGIWEPYFKLKGRKKDEESSCNYRWDGVKYRQTKGKKEMNRREMIAKGEQLIKEVDELIKVRNEYQEQIDSKLAFAKSLVAGLKDKKSGGRTETGVFAEPNILFEYVYRRDGSGHLVGVMVGKCVNGTVIIGASRCNRSAGDKMNKRRGVEIALEKINAHLKGDLEENVAPASFDDMLMRFAERCQAYFQQADSVELPFLSNFVNVPVSKNISEVKPLGGEEPVGGA